LARIVGAELKVEADTAAFYLARRAEGLQPLSRFAFSYKKRLAGIPHDFVVIYKGFEKAPDLAAARAEFVDIPHTELHISDDQFDIGAYLHGAAKVEATYVCFLNTHTEILTPDWLAYLRAAMRDPAVGMAGAFASLESLSDSLAVTGKAVWLAGIVRVPFDRKLAECYRFVLTAHAPDFMKGKSTWRDIISRRHYRNLEKSWETYWSTVCAPGGVYEYLPGFPRFPNPHLRSNGFIIERKRLLDFFGQIEPTKTAAYAFESGSNSLSTKVLRSGQKLALVDRHGRIYDQSRWSSSNTFRLGNQADIMFSDNQTRIFDALSAAERNTYVMITWGLDVCDRSRAYPLGYDFSKR
jgi:hypothetical protein